jgi:hypothetical protein
MFTALSWVVGRAIDISSKELSPATPSAWVPASQLVALNLVVALGSDVSKKKALKVLRRVVEKIERDDDTH